VLGGEQGGVQLSLTVEELLREWQRDVVRYAKADAVHHICVSKYVVSYAAQLIVSVRSAMLHS
jgi:hypothetical protein